MNTKREKDVTVAARVPVAALEPLAIDVPGAARLLGISVSAVYRLVAAGKLPKLDFGTNFIRIPRAGIERLVERSLMGTDAR
jgi:excisionase family DNA binding protein